MPRKRPRLTAWMLAAAIASCSSPRGPVVGGETHWLSACTADDECADENLSCTCGTCTRACSGNDPCAGGPPAACFDRRSPLLLQRCGGNEAELSAGVCLLECTSSSECLTNHACVKGACVPAVAVGDAGTAQAGSSAPSSVRISDFDSVNDNVDWTVPTRVPTLQSVVAGGDARITGTWLESGCDPTAPPDVPPWGCVRMMLAQSSAGDVTGTLQIDRAPDPDAEPPIRAAPEGGYAPAEDPDVGYPPGVDVKDYLDLRGNFQTGLPYRVLDGSFENGRLTFVWSTLDLWHDWCVMQNYYQWRIGDHSFSFCVPQNRDEWTGIDEGKIVLCTSADFEPLCSNTQGELLPCSCIAGDGNPRCSPAYCHCDSGGCDADVHALQVHTAFMVDGDTMTGSWQTHGDGWSGVLRRVSK